MTPDGHRKVTVRAGKASLRWGDITNLVRFCTRHSDEAVAFQNIVEFEAAWGVVGRASQVTFEEYYSRTARFGATDPRDRLFALLHLGCNTRHQVVTNPLLSPDYELPLELVILQFHRAGLELKLFIKLKFLSNGQFWNKTLTAQQEGLFEFDFQHGINTDSKVDIDLISTSGSDSWPSQPRRGNRLTEVGYSHWVKKLPSFTECPISSNTEQGEEMLIERSRLIFHCLLRFCQPLSLGVSELTFLIDILAMIGVPEAEREPLMRFFRNELELEPDAKGERLNSKKRLRMKGIARKLLGRNRSTLDPPEPEKSPATQQHSEELKRLQQLWSQYPDPHICITKDGRILLSHQQTWCGDSVVTLNGCPNPLILTPIQSTLFSGDGRWHLKLSGDCHFYPIDKVGRRTWLDRSEHQYQWPWKPYTLDTFSDAFDYSTQQSST